VTRRRTHRGFTLVETVVSLSVMSIVMLALGSVVMIASSAVPKGDERVHAELEMTRLVTDLTRDLTDATRVQAEFATSPPSIELDLGVLSVSLGSGVVKGATAAAGAGGVETGELVRSTDIETLSIRVPQGNDGVASYKVSYTYDPDAGTFSRLVSGTVRSPDVYGVTIDSLEIAHVDGDGRSISVGFTHADGVVSRSVIVELLNAPSVEVSP